MKKNLFCFYLLCSVTAYSQNKMPLKQSPAPPEYPTTLANLEFWYSPRKNVTKDGSNHVSAMADQSGNANDMNTFSNPTGATYTAGSLNGLPAIVFSNASGYGYGEAPRITNFDGLSAFTYAIVCNIGSVAYLNPGTNSFTGVHYSDTHFYGSVNNGSQYGDAGTYASAKVFIMVYDGTLSGNSNRLKIFVNGVQQTLSFAGTIPATSTVVANAANRVRINFYNVAIATTTTFYETLGVSRALTGTEVTNLNSFLQTMYAL